ncbi:MAG: threonine-phosphate decarboxylase CobD [Sneathiella sp.]|nr:threonine-phosphate decarboxylase CobD [Sneathiella sp.]
MIPTFLQKAENGPQFHGGDLNWASALFGHDISEWLDLSTGINPHPYPVPEVTADAWQRLPTLDAEIDLLDAAKNYYSVSDAAGICALPGTQSAIQLLPRLAPPSEVEIVSPTYNEHAACWSRAGHKVREINGFEDISEAAKIVILVHPNNPDGRKYPIRDLKALAEKLHGRGDWLIIDEAFTDTVPEISLAPGIDDNGPLILKSFGKFFGLAGLRLGFLIGSPSFIDKIRGELGPWAVSGIALEIGAKALADNKWITSTRVRLSQSSRRLTNLLTQNGLKIVGGTDLFCLTESDGAADLFRHLCAAAILCRMFPEQPNFLRFGHPETENDWNRLETSLRDWAGSENSR